MSATSKSTTGESPRHQRLVSIRFDLIDDWRASQGLSVTEFCENQEIGKATYSRMKRGEPVEIFTAKKLADGMGLADVRELLDGEFAAAITSARLPTPLMIDEWSLVKPLGDWIKATNGLQYRIFQMRNRFSSDQLARGKCYELDGLYDQERQRVDECFKRHSDICRKVGQHANLPVSYRSSPDPTGRFWWIIDSWPGETMLAEQLNGQRQEPIFVKRVMSQVASGLRALHAANVVRRELAPRNIAFDVETGRVVLTDFELGKLLDGAVTVSKGQWPMDPYRAPEVGKGRTTPAADIFSWGRLFVELAAGKLPPNGQEEAALQRLMLPRELREFVACCVDVIPAIRPKTLESGLKMMLNWS